MPSCRSRHRGPAGVRSPASRSAAATAAAWRTEKSPVAVNCFGVGTDSAAGRAIADRVGEQLRARAGEPGDPQPRPGSEEDDEDDGDTTIWR